VEGAGDADVRADGHILSGLDALDLPVADAGGVAEPFLGEVPPLADVGDDPADAPQVLECRRVE
jgi:hypothetical protein